MRHFAGRAAGCLGPQTRIKRRTNTLRMPDEHGARYARGLEVWWLASLLAV